MFDHAQICRHLSERGRVVRVVIADSAGSVPREIGASMLVWQDGQTGTIGGGALEFAAANAAREMLLSPQKSAVSKHPLGPALGQCCGGSVTLVSEVLCAGDITDLESHSAFLRRVYGQKDVPLSLKRALKTARSEGITPSVSLTDGWLLEPLARVQTPLWIWGAGHVGRALIHTLAPLPDYDITWIDTAADRYPKHIPSHIRPLTAKNPALLATHAPVDAKHLILTYSHALDLDICHRVLSRGFLFAGLIGSATKWRRFQKRLSDLGHGDAQISRITCPIGTPSLGKHPQSIAIGVAMQLMALSKAEWTEKDLTA